MSCPEATVLADYWMGHDDSIEEHLLGCGSCATKLGEIATLADAIRQLARRGTFRVVLSETMLRRSAETGLQVRQYAASSGGRVHCTITAKDDLLIGRLAADLSGVERLDLSLCDMNGVERDRRRDIPFHQAGREVIVNEPADPAREMGANVLIMKLVSVRDSGETLLGQYTFDHTPSW